MSARSDTTAGQLLSPVIETKLLPPRSHAGTVGRRRLLARLDELAGRALIVIEAPVGFGKTVLAEAWCASRPEAATVWVSLDGADNDSVRLWTHVATALDRVDPPIGGRALARLRAPGAPIEGAVEELANGLSRFDRPIDIVLDDLHLVTNAAALRPLEQLIDRLPPNARIVVLTRSDPPIRLGRLRAGRLLGEIRQRDLAFTVDEATALLIRQEGLPLTPADVALLVERTEGWPAGLYLAGLWLRGFDDPAEAVRDFSGDQRHVADYLATEVLQGLDADDREFLVRTSVLDRFSASLCDAVLERDDAAVLLDRLTAANGFIVSLDGRHEWFRYHHLFRDLLALELRRVDPGAAVELHRRAGQWFAARDLVEEAIEHAAGASDTGAIVAVLREHHMALTRTGRAATLLRWIGALPDAALIEAPELAAIAATTGGLLARPAAERHHFLALTERARTEFPAGWTDYPAALTALARAVWIPDDVGSMIAAARTAVDLSVVSRTEFEVPANAWLSYATYLGGETEAAMTAATLAIDHPTAMQRPFGLMGALAVSALIELERGRPLNGEADAERAVAVARAAEIVDTSLAGIAFLALAAARAATGRMSSAEREAEHAEVLLRGPERTVRHAHALLVLTAIRLHRGRLDRAAAGLDQARQEIGAFRDPGRLPALADDLQRELDQARARSTAGRVTETPTESELLVLRLLAGPQSLREIAATLFLSVNTVKTHTRSLYRKLDASSREQAVVRAGQLGLLDTGTSPG